ncbi:MAG: MiaB/RimO family radical SAM methylthiotransferase [Endomicrobium sp.]|jgi:threonylcarbamoyladenosine tRNA methylthiotransferase MtaB|nr:MiaB/RimO family radical SAM methylthiotransferase [Endomicrobium sp.]
MEKYFIRTFGCKVNQYESQLIFEKYKKNFEYTYKFSNANIIIINSCTVTAKADQKCLNFLKNILKLPNKPKIILTGCIVKKNIDFKKLFPMIEIIKDKTKLFSINKQNIQNISHFHKHSRAFVKIQDGCNDYCTYCVIPYVRNVFYSKPVNEIILEIINLVKNGYFEIVLTGINIGKHDNNISYLIKKIIKIPLNFRIRISSIELNKVDNELIELIKENPNKICNHLHIPLQSGCDEILEKMNRKYSTQKFKKRINEIMQFLPDLALTTDIITGFPGETKKHYEKSYDFILQIPFAKLQIFSYSDRDYTKASKFENKISINEIKIRVKNLLKLNNIKKNEFIKKHIGTIRKAVKIRTDTALTDNYIRIKINNLSKKQHGIFTIKVTKTAKI